MKLPPRYMSANHTVKKDGKLEIITAEHVCGLRLFYCTKCNRLFCPSCDFTPDNPKSCCACAIDAYNNDSQDKWAKRQEVKRLKSKNKAKKRPYCRYRVKLEEIACDGTL